MASRSLARSASRTVVLADLAALGATPGGPVEMVEVVALDAARAARAAKSLAQRAVTVFRSGGSSADVTAALKPGRALVASTESAEAFNLERAAVADHATAVHLLKVWDAQLDKRTCPTCSSLDGKIVSIGESFGVAQPAHPRCRCTFTFLRGDEAAGSLTIKAIGRST